MSTNPNFNHETANTNTMGTGASDPIGATGATGVTGANAGKNAGQSAGNAIKSTFAKVHVRFFRMYFALFSH
jgi:hypothetical protein